LYPVASEYREQLANLHAQAITAGRDPLALQTAAIVPVCLASTRDFALDIAQATLETRFGSVARGLERTAVGTSADVESHLAELRDAGLRYLQIRMICHDITSMHAMMSQFATTLLPTVG
jgi:alkanesulfonate monooxygenase SsuD/methylene tetrahydromethanopterin reductase-like flavin-dependent oxidoreductase (luciferase family)